MGRRAAAGFVVGVIATTLACKGPARVEANADANANAQAKADANAQAQAQAQAKADAKADANASATADAAVAAERVIGPFEVPLEATRKVYYVAPKEKKNGRLIANLHGVCNPPGYACGYWVEAASKVGFLVCPEGNSRCGAKGPPTWSEPMPKMDADLEKAIAIVDGNHPGEMSREGSILTGFSLGATVAAQIARLHPGRWPYLVLVEADVQLDVAQLRAAGVRAVALIAGEIGGQVAGERRTAERLAKQGYPAKLWVMKGAGHHYSGDIDTIMSEAIAFVLSEGGDAGAADGGR